jgi:hypothetical protein
LLAFSPDIAGFVTENGFDLYAKNDYRFMESVIKLLLTQFNYKASISIQQFFAVGFAEHKMILCRDICRLIREKSERLAKDKQSKFKVVRHFQGPESDGQQQSPAFHSETHKMQEQRYLPTETNEFSSAQHYSDMVNRESPQQIPKMSNNYDLMVPQ